MEICPIATLPRGLSRLGFGSLALTYPQSQLSAAAIQELLLGAESLGLNWLDTAEQYENYHLLAPALQHSSLQVISKSYAYEYAAMTHAVEVARAALGRDVIEVFLLHEQESVLTLLGHQAAFEALLAEKAKGRIKAVGVSTHAIEVVQALAEAKSTYTQGLWAEFKAGSYADCDFVFSIVNQTSIGLLDGNYLQMEAALAQAGAAGLNVLGMKVFAGGHLLQDRLGAVAYALSRPYVNAYAIGMKSQAELELNVALFQGQEPSPELLARSLSSQRQLHVASYCTGCGACVKRCKSKALSLIDGKAVVDKSRCTLCSYCAFACRDYCLKII